jgi:hypothetical protein
MDWEQLMNFRVNVRSHTEIALKNQREIFA